ncbi:polysaccharide lyase family 8 super-sandwich domain-containing protein [Streptosporangium canum]|uniref:polysaccharide lyase family 8 super-sandwich domain-containing protein n=1 Tax=Streptosporangium canum TaxID=324952 RepID=UPI0033B9D1F1
MAHIYQSPPTLVGCRYYPRSDYLVHRRLAWPVSVRMASTRTAPTESMNGENLRGRHLGDGGTLTARHGADGIALTREP